MDSLLFLNCVQAPLELNTRDLLVPLIWAAWLIHPVKKSCLNEWLTGYSRSTASIQPFFPLVSVSFPLEKGINRGSKPVLTKAVPFRVPWSHSFRTGPGLLCRGPWYISYIVCGAFSQSPVMSVCTLCQAEHWRGDLETGSPHPTHPVVP